VQNAAAVVDNLSELIFHRPSEASDKRVHVDERSVELEDPCPDWSVCAKRTVHMKRETKGAMRYARGGGQARGFSSLRD